MKVSEVKYTRRFNLGNYEHEEVAMSAILEEADEGFHIEALVALKKDVIAAQTSEAAVADEVPAPAKKAKAKKDSEPAEDEDADEEAVDKEEESEEEEEAGEAPKKKKFKKKPQTYSRSSEQHKEILSSVVLKSVAPDWKKTPESKELAKAVSLKMEGKDFLDENGEVLPEFSQEVKQLMTPAKKKKK